MEAVCLGGEYILMDENSEDLRYPLPFGRCTGHNQCRETPTDYCSTWIVLPDFSITDRHYGLYTRTQPSKVDSELLKKNLVMIVPPATSAARSIFRPLWYVTVQENAAFGFH